MTTKGPAGRFITFEGIEGCGKSTQVARLSERLRASGRRVTATREPGGTELGLRLRSLLLRPTESPMSPTAELLLYTADRAQHLAEVVIPALERGDIVICDRYLDATLAYQGSGRGLAWETILDLHKPSPLDLRPARTILLDLEISVGLARARLRDLGEPTRREGRFEEERQEFHERVRDGYLRLARESPQRIRIVDGSDAAERVGQRVWDALADLLAEDGATSGNS